MNGAHRHRRGKLSISTGYPQRYSQFVWKRSCPTGKSVSYCNVEGAPRTTVGWRTANYDRIVMRTATYVAVRGRKRTENYDHRANAHCKGRTENYDAPGAH